ncbi:hypothetical protein [Pseudonocardia hydrocarbonoxydans]|uniref:Uncharacterized protein n=1 Tax=Pseudonocardia hydrocarbonoxydans TaxID=76726 RepID=A0A4Y3WSC3_9PSEU|nr:hypothetical protein [Pseudonocardia hydrocarbonoxydans]GEC21000.1 hypothetical protein PHY01_32830 [Pseudonocardia hydrocarbonoxydans]
MDAARTADEFFTKLTEILVEEIYLHFEDLRDVELLPSGYLDRVLAQILSA